MRNIFILALLATGCMNQKHLVCHGDNISPVVFSHGPHGVGLHKNVFHFSQVQTQPKRLTARQPSGNHYLQVDDKKIVLQYIQDVVQVKRKKSPTCRTQVQEYHAVFPSLNEYIFDKKNSTLTVHYSLLYPPRSLQKRCIDSQKFTSPHKLPLEQASHIFPPKKITTKHYPRCTP